MKKNVFDKGTVNEQLVLLSKHLETQRNAKKSLLSYLEKVSEYISNENITEDSEALVSCLNSVQDIFDNIKNITDKLIELRLFLENISKSTSLNVIDFEKYNTQFIELEENIKRTNTSYNNFMENLVSLNLIDFSKLEYEKLEPTIIEKTIDNNTTVNYQPVALEGIHSLEAFEKMIETISETEANLENEDINNTTETTVNEINNSSNNIETINVVPVENTNIETTENIDSKETEISNTSIVTEETIDTVEKNTSIIENSETTNLKTQDESFTTEDIVEEPNTIENAIEEIENIDNKENVTNRESVTTNFLEKTLFINYKSNTAILPYSLFDLEEAFSENPEKYSSINDIIKKEYTVSLDDYTNNSISRFKQTFKLAKERSHLSFFESLSYANRLFFESDVEPIIIAACDSIHELDCYLEYLNNDFTTPFNCFNIINQE